MTFPVQQFFSEDDVSDDDGSPEKPGTSAEEARSEMDDTTQTTRQTDSGALLSDSTVQPAASVGRPKRRKRARYSADSLGRDIWLPLYGMTLLEEEALPALALCPSRYILLRCAAIASSMRDFPLRRKQRSYKLG